MKIATTFNMPVFEGTVSAELNNAMEKKKLLGRGKHSDAMQEWMLSGFLLDQMGSGVMKQWLSMEENGELKGLSNKEKMIRLAQILNFFAGIHVTPEPIPADTSIVIPIPVSKHPKSKRKNPNELRA